MNSFKGKVRPKLEMQRRSMAAGRLAVKMQLVKRVCQATGAREDLRIYCSPFADEPVPSLVLAKNTLNAFVLADHCPRALLRLACNYEALIPGDVGSNIYMGVVDGVWIPISYKLCDACGHVMRKCNYPAHRQSAKCKQNVEMGNCWNVVTYPKPQVHPPTPMKRKVRVVPTRCSKCKLMSFEYAKQGSKFKCSDCDREDQRIKAEYISDARRRKIMFRCCQLCDETDKSKLTIQHDHSQRPATVEHVLCQRCNSLIGKFGDDKHDFLVAAIGMYSSSCGDFGANHHCSLDPPYKGLHSIGDASVADVLDALK